MTEMRKDTVWFHEIVDFSTPSASGELRADAIAKGILDEEHVYSFQGAFRDCRLVLFEKEKDSDEPCAVYIFPFMGESYQVTHGGVVLLRTWDITNGIFPAIITRSPVKGHETPGVVNEEGTVTELETRWKERFAGVHNVLPLPNR